MRFELQSFEFILCFENFIVQKCQTTANSLDICCMIQLVVFKKHWLDFLRESLHKKMYFFGELLHFILSDFVPCVGTW